MENLSVEELAAEYREAVHNYRYYADTDDYDNWERERVQRTEARNKMDDLWQEFKRRGMTPPRVS